MVFCHECGEDCGTISRFCHACGTRLRTQAAPSTQSSTRTVTNTSGRAKDDEKKSVKRGRGSSLYDEDEQQAVRKQKAPTPGPRAGKAGTGKSTPKGIARGVGAGAVFAVELSRIAVTADASPNSAPRVRGRGAVHAENRSVFARLSRDGGNGGAGATAKRKNVLDRIEKPKPVFSSEKSVRGRGNSLAEQ